MKDDWNGVDSRRIQRRERMNRQYQRNLKMITNLVLALMILLLFVFVVPKVIVFFMPFVIGWIISCIANPLVQLLESKIKMKRKAGTVVVIILVIGTIVGVGYLLVSILARQLQGFITSLPQMWENLEQDIASVWNLIDGTFRNLSPRWVETLRTAGNVIGDTIQGIGSHTEATASVGVIGSIANGLISVIMCMLSSYFFIAERDYVFKLARRVIPASMYTRYGVVYKSLRQAVGGYFKAQFKIEIWIYLLIFLGLTFLGVDYSFLIAFAIAALDFLPFFGTSIVFVPWAILKIISGNYFMAVAFVVIWGVSQLVRQLIQPKFVSDSIGMPPIPTLFLLFIGYKVAGVIGMILAVPIGIIIVNMYEAGLFDTPKLSLKILLRNLNQYRKLDEEDLSVLKTDKIEENDKKIDIK